MRAALATAAERAAGLPVATLGHKRWRPTTRAAHQSRAGRRAHPGSRVRGLLAVGGGAVQVSGVVVLARPWAFDTGHQGLCTHRGRLVRVAAAAQCVRGMAALVPAAEHFGPDLSTYLSDNVYDQIRAPLLNLGFSDDPIATRRTVAELDKFYPNAARETRWYTPAEAGSHASVTMVSSPRATVRRYGVRHSTGSTSSSVFPHEPGNRRRTHHALRPVGAG